MIKVRDGMGRNCLEVILKGKYVLIVEGSDGKRD